MHLLAYVPIVPIGVVPEPQTDVQIRVHETESVDQRAYKKQMIEQKYTFIDSFYYIDLIICFFWWNRDF